MQSHSNFSLKTKNTFALDCIAEQLLVISDREDLSQLPNLIRQYPAFYILGEGSNTLFIEPKVNFVINLALKGIEIIETATDYIVTAAAGENWHNFVVILNKQDINGLENLVLIPGSVGAAPVQNIGAYGVELKDYCHSVTWFDFAIAKEVEILAADCHFAYRDSIFKGDLKNKGLITAVTFKLPKAWQANLSYQDLANLPEPITATAIMEKVIAVRQAKLPDPNVIPNAGSFFKNPVVSAEKYKQLADGYPNMPFYQQADGNIKLAAGWLIDQCGLKGHQLNNAAIHKNQALVLVNHGGATGADIVALAKYVKDKVAEKFSVNLSPEVRFIASSGEIDAQELINGN